LLDEIILNLCFCIWHYL